LHPVARWRSICLIQSIAWVLALAVAMRAQSSQSGVGALIFVPPAGSVAVGNTLQLTAYKAFSPTAAKNAVAINNNIQWRSSNTNIATVTSTGLVTGVNVGPPVTITAISGPFHGTIRLTVTPSALSSIAVTSPSPSESKGLSQQFTATGTYTDTSTADITSSVNWSSSNINIATISSTGVAKGKNVGGPITITARDPSTGITGATQLTVTPAVLVSIVITPANPLVPKGATQQLTATGVYTDNSTQDLTASVNWTSSNIAIAPIGINTGLVTGSTIGGPVTITAQDPTTMISGTVQLTVGPPVVVSIAVAPGSATIVQSANQQFTATGTFTDASTADITNSVNWTSGSNIVARIGLNTGLAAGMNGGGPATITATDPITGISGTAQLTVQYAVVTYHNDMGRTGQDISETMLTPATVNKTHFGRQFSQTVDGYIYAQPLYMPGVNIAGLVHNVVYAATEHDSVYAFDADNNAGANANPLWKASLIPPGGSTVSSGDAGCGDLVPEIGITSTPVIDANTGTLYVVSKTKENGKFFQRLHALDITSGAEKFGGPVTIQASVKGTGDGSNGTGVVTFNPLREHNRTSLLLQNGLVYIGWASHCDNGPYHGWLMAYNPATLAQMAVFNTSPNSGLSGIWMAGAGLAGDGTNVFFATGNGTFDVNNSGKDYGDSIMSVGPPSAGTPPATFPVLSYFTPFNQSNLNGGDVDLGSGGVLLLPTQTGQHPHLLVQVGKGNTIYLVDRDNMGGYCASCTSRDTQIVQELQGAVGGMWGMPAFWNNNIYFGGSGDHVKAYSFNASGTGLLSANPTSRSAVSIGNFGPTPSVSASGNSNGIVWVIQADAYGGPGPAILRAFDATNLATELYNSTQNAGDSPGGAVKFTVPTIANGKVYVGTSSQLSVFALH